MRWYLRFTIQGLRCSARLQKFNEARLGFRTTASSSAIYAMSYSRVVNVVVQVRLTWQQLRGCSTCARHSSATDPKAPYKLPWTFSEDFLDCTPFTSHLGTKLLPCISDQQYQLTLHHGSTKPSTVSTTAAAPSSPTCTREREFEPRQYESGAPGAIWVKQVCVSGRRPGLQGWRTSAELEGPKTKPESRSILGVQ